MAKRKLERYKIESPSFMAGALEFRSISLMQYLEPDFPKAQYPLAGRSVCMLCKQRKATHYIWEANVGMLIGEDTCHVFMCGKCVVMGLYIQREYVGCAICKRYWPVPCYSVKLANGKDSSLLCKDCHLNGGHREELLEAINNPGPKIRLNKSM